MQIGKTKRNYEVNYLTETIPVICPHCDCEFDYEFPEEVIDQSDGELNIMGDQDCPCCDEYITIELDGDVWVEGAYTSVTIEGYKELEE
jgi:hypothetical protein